MVAIFLLLILVFTPPSLGSGGVADPEHPPRTKWLVGSAYDHAPYEYAVKGHATGFDIDLIRAVAEVMDVEVETRLGAWSALKEDLKAGRLDLLAGMIYTPEREAAFDFSVPFVMISPGLFVRKDSSVRSFADLQGKEVLVQEGDVTHELLAQAGIAARIVPVAGTAEALRRLASGEQDAVLMPSKLLGLHDISRFGLTNLKAVPAGLPARPYGFAVQEGNQALVHQLNEGLKILKATGKYQQIYDKWFGVYEPSLLTASKPILIALAVIAAVLAVSLFWSWSLRRQVRLRTAELRTSEERFRALVEQAPEAILVYDVEAGELIEVNQNAERLFGCAREELLQRGPLSFYPPAQPDGRPVQESFQEHNAQALAGAEVICERTIQPAHGGLVHCEVRVVRFPSAERHLLRASFIDITERKRAEAALRASEERFRVLIEQAPEAILVYDDDEGRFVQANQNAERLFGCPREEILQKGLEYFYAPNQPDGRPVAESIQAHIRQALAGEELAFERIVHPVGGGEVYCDVRAVALPTSVGRKLRVSYIDITPRKQAEEELRKHRDHLEELVDERTAELATANEALAQRSTQLRALAHQLIEAEQRERRRIAYVLHENFQQILAATKYSIQRFRDKASPEAVQQALTSLDQAISISRSLTVELRPPMLHELGLEPALEWLGRQAAEKFNLTVELQADHAVNPASEDLRSFLFEVVNELLLNVAKHAQVKKAQVRLSQVDDLIELEVVDHGRGFEPAQAQSTSFGLFSIRERVELLGGRVEIDSTPGRGTRVTLRVPLREPEPPSQAT